VAAGTEPMSPIVVVILAAVAGILAILWIAR
jgi:hypothetical protein